MQTPETPHFLDHAPTAPRQLCQCLSALARPLLPCLLFFPFALVDARTRSSGHREADAPNHTHASHRQNAPADRAADRRVRAARVLICSNRAVLDPSKAAVPWGGWRGGATLASSPKSSPAASPTPKKGSSKEPIPNLFCTLRSLRAAARAQNGFGKDQHPRSAISQPRAFGRVGHASVRRRSS